MDPRCSCAFVAAALLLVAAGCGGGKGSSTGTTTTPTGAFAFASCMRAHGVPDWPYPDSSGHFDKTRLRALGYSQARMQALERPCAGLLPSTGVGSQTPQQRQTRLADERSFARCMRGHGIANFPDPTVQAGLTVEMVEAQGIDVHAQAFLRIVQRCLPASHGALTPAQVRKAIAEAG